MSLLMDTLEKAQRDAAKLSTAPLVPPKISPRPDLKPAAAQPSKTPERTEGIARETAVVSLIALIVGICVAGLAAAGIRSLSKPPEFFSAMPHESNVSSAKLALPALQGIVRDGSHAYCLINGQILKPGDFWQEYKIQSVEDGAVIFLQPSGKTVTLRLKS